MNFKKKTALLLALVTATGMFSGCSKQTATKDGSVEVSFLNCWQGSEAPSGVDYASNPVADVIAEKTGVRLKYLSCPTSEIERLNLAFSTGDVPDIVSAPFWGAHDPHTQVIKKAAEQGLLLPLNDYIEQYAPNLKDAWSPELISRDYLENDFEPPVFEGEHYFFTTSLPLSDLDRPTPNAYNAYIRKDILEALGVDPASISDSEKLYELMKQVKAGNFKDVNGNDVIVSGTWHSGWTFEPFYNTYVSQRDMFSSFKHENGEIKLYQNTERYAKQVLYLRKLRAEGLLDLECTTQTNAQAVEKMSTGKVAIVGSPYTTVYDTLKNVLYKDHPEMEYVPLGPIMNMDGEPYQNTGVARKKWGGGGVIFVSATAKHPEKIMEFLNYLNSDEGVTLLRYGIEGTHYELVDGKPRLKEDILKSYEEDPLNLPRLGINLYTPLILKTGYATRFGEDQYGKALNEYTEAQKHAIEVSPTTYLEDVYSLNFVATRYPKWDEILNVMNTGDGGLMNKAGVAETEEEALEYIRQSREFYAKNGMTEFEAWMTEHQNDTSEELAALDAAAAQK
ncbi:MAG: extracellular solute-binding protein [Ruminococcaceae bacterium]|nr:extracellular solute-binding protein [Oscillospiraceae bacterium]